VIKVEFLRFIIIVGFVWVIIVPLQLNLKRLLKIYDKVFPFSILREGATYDTAYDNFKDYITNEGKILNLSVPVIILAIPVLFLSESNYFFNLGFYLTFAIPSAMLLCRIKTFGDNSILPETGLGYEPIGSWLLSYLCLMWGLVVGFSALNFADILLYFPLITISLALISSMIPMFPDYINKLLPYEIRSEKGMWTLRIITAVAICIQLVANVYLSSLTS